MSTHTFTNDPKVKYNNLPPEAQANGDMAEDDYNAVDARKRGANDAYMDAARRADQSRYTAQHAAANFAEAHVKTEAGCAHVEMTRKEAEREGVSAEKLKAVSKKTNAVRVYNPANTLKALALSTVCIYTMSRGEFDAPNIKLPKGMDKIEYLMDVVRPERPKFFKEFDAVQKLPQALEEIRGPAINAVREFIRSRDFESVTNGFFTRNYTGPTDTHGYPNSPRFSEGKLLKLLAQPIVDAFDRELCARADKLGARQITLAEREAKLLELQAAIVANDRLDCDLVRLIRKENPDAPVYFREDADPFHVLDIIVDPDVEQPKPEKAIYETFDTVPSNMMLVTK